MPSLVNSFTVETKLIVHLKTKEKSEVLITSLNVLCAANIEALLLNGFLILVLP